MTKKKAERFGQAGGRAVKRAMGADWFKILGQLRWGVISRAQFLKLRAARMKVKKQ